MDLVQSRGLWLADGGAGVIKSLGEKILGTSSSSALIRFLATILLPTPTARVGIGGV